MFLKNIKLVMAAAAFIGIHSCTVYTPLYYSTAEPQHILNTPENYILSKEIVIQEDFSPEMKEFLATIEPSSNSAYQKAREKAQLIADPMEQNFAAGFLLLLDHQFDKAQMHFIIASSKIPQSEILLLDCQAELRNGTDLYADYQKLYDSTTDPVLRKVIKNRYKFYRHAL